ncbi:MAG: hypothetical protein FJ096_19860 [Deltaproteobacteria bacterium]|nr:hypothetical protein [Deltaproteobacteria bacterium]
MVGGRTLPEGHEVDPDTASRLVPAQPYLWHPSGQPVSLYPGAGAERAPRGWTLGWYKEAVKTPTLRFVSSAEAFTLAVDERSFESLLSAQSEAEEGPSEEALALEPWRGLLPYTEEHKELFFGRTALTGELAARLDSRRVAVLCGASGAGKSSLMHAGVVPALRAREQALGRALLAVSLVPGARPLERLRHALIASLPEKGASDVARWSREVCEQLPNDAAKANPAALAHLVRGLSADGRRLALLVDQLEEVTTLCADPVERGAFLDLLCGVAQAAANIGAYVLLTVRADKVDAILEHAPTRALVRRGIEPVGGMTRDELVEVVLGPLRGRGVAVEPGLAERIAADVGDEPGALALVSQVLSVLWSQRGRHGDRLTTAMYEAEGGVLGVLGKQADAARAEAVGDGDGAKDRASTLDRVLVQLAHRGEDGTFTRRRSHLESLAQSVRLSKGELEALLAPLVARRLLVTSGGLPVSEASAKADGAPAAATRRDERADELEVAHEALLRAWPALRQLLEQEADVSALRQEVERAATAWEGSSRRSELWSDATSKLRLAEELVASGRLPLAARELAFLRASRAGVRRARAWARAGIAAIVSLALASSGLGWGSWRAARRAERATEKAEQATERAEASTMESKRALVDALAAQAEGLAKDQPFEAAQLALEALATVQSIAGLEPPQRVRQALASVAFVASGARVTLAHPGLRHASVAPDGTRVVTASWDKTARLWDAQSGTLLTKLEGHTATIVSAAFSPEGTHVLTSGPEGLGEEATLWNLSSEDHVERACIAAHSRFDLPPNAAVKELCTPYLERVDARPPRW